MDVSGASTENGNHLEKDLARSLNWRVDFWHRFSTINLFPQNLHPSLPPPCHISFLPRSEHQVSTTIHHRVVGPPPDVRHGICFSKFQTIQVLSLSKTNNPQALTSFCRPRWRLFGPGDFFLWTVETKIMHVEIGWHSFFVRMYR